MSKEEREHLYNILTAEKLKCKKLKEPSQNEGLLNKKRELGNNNLEEDLKKKNMINPLNLSQISTVQQQSYIPNYINYKSYG